jgi:hypothetical protein
MKADLKFISILILVCICSSHILAQDWSLTLSGELKSPVKITPKEFASFPRSTVMGIDHDGKQNEYAGVSLYYLLVKGGAPVGDSIHGKNLLLYLQAEALDGYKVVYALPEIDTLFTNRTILVADKKNGSALDEKEGPLQIIVPGEKKHSRWMRQLISLRVLRSKE